MIYDDLIGREMTQRKYWNVTQLWAILNWKAWGQATQIIEFLNLFVYLFIFFKSRVFRTDFLAWN